MRYVKRRRNRRNEAGARHRLGLSEFDGDVFDINADYNERLGNLEEIIRREDIITLPERDAVIRLATEAESAAIPASFMSPPQLINNTGQLTPEQAVDFMVEQNYGDSSLN